MLYMSICSQTTFDQSNLVTFEDAQEEWVYHFSHIVAVLRVSAARLAWHVLCLVRNKFEQSPALVRL